jgi:hypothetical protein
MFKSIGYISEPGRATDCIIIYICKYMVAQDVIKTTNNRGFSTQTGLLEVCGCHFKPRKLVIANVVSSSPILVTQFNVGPKFLRNAGYYKSHTA